MKKNYFKPEAELVDVRIDAYILSNSVGITDTPTGPKDAEQSRGEWGDFWKKWFPVDNACCNGRVMVGLRMAGVV